MKSLSMFHVDAPESALDDIDRAVNPPSNLPPIHGAGLEIPFNDSSSPMLFAFGVFSTRFGVTYSPFMISVRF